MKKKADNDVKPTRGTDTFFFKNLLGNVYGGSTQCDQHIRQDGY